MKFASLPISQLIQTPFACDCGRTHLADIRQVCIGKGVTSRIEEFLAAQPTKGRMLEQAMDELLIVCDPNTRKVFGDTLAQRLTQEGWKVRMHCFAQSQPHATMALAQELMEDITPATGLLLAVGSGTVNDLSRYASYQKALPYYIIATAPSMDGFASTVSPLVVDDLKQTFEAHCADCIIGDTDLLATCPDRMLAAGLGDVLGKVWSVHDWEMSHQLLGEYYCPEIAALMNQAVDRCKQAVPGLQKRDSKALEQLMEALVLAGIAMAFAGNSRPASSGEHHIAHCLEMQSIFGGEYGELHGINVGLGTLVMGSLYRNFLACTPDKDKAMAHAKAFDWKDYQTRMEALYQKGAPAVLELEQKEQRHAPEATIQRIEAYFAHEEEINQGIAQALEQLSGSAQLMQSLDGYTDFAPYPHSKEMWKAILRDAKEIRSRYTGLQLMDDLGLLEELVEKTVEEFWRG